MTATETLTLADFLLARYAEDEAEASRWQAKMVEWAQANAGASVVLFAAGDPARVLAECEAKRRIVDMHRYAPRHVGTTALNHLALPYADHPDYRQEWKP